MTDFDKAAATAKRLIEANGRVVQIFKQNRTPEDSDAPWEGTTAQPHQSKEGAEISITMAFVPARGTGFGSLIVQAARDMNVSLDQIGMIASDSIPSGFTPADIEEADKVRDGDKIWSIVIKEHLKPASTSLIFTLGLKA